MTQKKARAAVLGAGVMGTGIAAHLASVGIETLLLDMVPEGTGTGPGRSRLASQAVEKALKARPAPFFDAEAARRIVPGNFEDDLPKLRDCELVIEAVTERLDVKQSLFERLSAHVGETTILASNTSGLSVAKMAEKLPPGLAERFVVMHFFNPVRYMHLVEVVPGPKTSPQVLQKVARLSSDLGKGVVYGKDTVNFVANRIGVFSMLHAIHEMPRHNLSIEEVDKVAGKPMARASSAAFRTADLVGIDTLAHVAKNCRDNLPMDADRDVFTLPGWVEGMVKAGQLGSKTGAGFYKKVGADIQVLDASSLAYRPQKKVQFASLDAVRRVEDPRARLAQLVWAEDNAAKFAWSNVARTLVYAAERIGEIADDVVNVDRAMCWGFNWLLGPFEAWDAIGVRRSVERMRQENMRVPKWVQAMLDAGTESFYGDVDGRPGFWDVQRAARVALPVGERELRFEVLKKRPKAIIEDNKAVSTVDLGDGIWALEVHTKMNTIDVDVMAGIERSVARAEREARGLVLANDGEHFGAGFNLLLLYQAMQARAFDQIETMIARFQNVGQRLRYASVPVVAAPFQYTFGGALELALACDARQAHAESYMGLVEAGVGLIPGGGGCMRLLDRATQAARLVENVDLLPFVGAASLQVATARVSTSAEEARRLFYLGEADGITLDRASLLGDAKGRALGLALAGYRPPVPASLRAAGVDAAATLRMRIWSMVEGKHVSAHDALVAGKAAHVLCGGDRPQGAHISEEDVLELEREAFLSLCGHEKTQARIESMMLHNKPLRN